MHRFWVRHSIRWLCAAPLAVAMVVGIAQRGMHRHLPSQCCSSAPTVVDGCDHSHGTAGDSHPAVCLPRESSQPQPAPPTPEKDCWVCRYLAESPLPLAWVLPQLGEPPLELPVAEWPDEIAIRAPRPYASRAPPTPLDSRAF